MAYSRNRSRRSRRSFRSNRSKRRASKFYRISRGGTRL